MKIIFWHVPASILAGLLLLTSCVSKEFPVTENYFETQYKTEYETRVSSENQTAIISTKTGEFALPSYFGWSSSILSFQGSSNLYYYGYEIPDSSSYDNIRLRVSIWQQMKAEPAVIRVFDMSKVGQLSSPMPLSADEVLDKIPKWYMIKGTATNSWLEEANSMMNQARFLGGSNYTWSKPANPQVIELDAGRADKIAVIVSGPQNKWNAAVTLDALWTLNTLDQHQITTETQVPKQVSFQVQKQRTVYKVRQVPIWELFFSP